MPKEQAQLIAAERARQALRGIDWARRAASLGLETPEAGVISLRAFGQELSFDTRQLKFSSCDPSLPVSLGDQILILHYMACEEPLEAGGALKTFRVFQGGQFYWQPFLSRSTEPLVRAIGDDLDRLKGHLDRFDWQPLPRGDLGAKIHGFGLLTLTLIYHCSDEEFGPSAEVLFEDCALKALSTEDAAVFAGRICLGLL